MKAQILLSLALVSGCGSAHADLKAVVKVSVEGAPRAGSPGGGTVTIYQSGSKLRVERDGTARVLLVDGDKRYVLDTEAKTYYIPAPREPNGGEAEKSLQLSKTSETKVIASISTTRYDLKGEIKVQGGGAGGGRAGRFGNRGGGGLGGGGGLSFKVDGALWVAPDLPKIELRDLIGERGAAVRTSLNQVSFDGLVLAGNIKVTPPAVLAQRMGVISLNFEAQSVVQAPQPADLFTLPEGYRKVDPPSTPGGFFSR